MNLFDLLESAAVDAADQPALTDLRTGRCLRYGELCAEARRVADVLLAQGVRAGDRVGLLAGNGLGYVPAAFGILAAGGCLVPVAPGLADVERAALLAGLRVNACLAWPPAEATGEAREPVVARVATGACAGYALRWVHRGAEPPDGLSALRPAFIRFTSGTTAERKGVVLSHEATWTRAAAAAEVLGLRPDDRVFWMLPLSHHFAVTITAYVARRLHVLLCSDAFPGAQARALLRHRATVLYASPVHLARLAAAGPLASSGRGDLRLAVSTTAALPPDVAFRFERTWGTPPGQAYGLIEAGLPCINTGSDGVPCTSVGRPVPGYEVAVLDDEGRELPAGTVGEVGVRGRGLFSAYFSPWRPLADVLEAGWFRTGDLGALEATSVLTLVGRKKSVITVAGMKVFPEEVEVVLGRHPAVAEARVFGGPHPALGEVPVAEIVLAAGERLDPEALRAHCARQLSPHKVPLEFRTVEALPRTPGGKLLRRPAARPGSSTP